MAMLVGRQCSLGVAWMATFISFHFCSCRICPPLTSLSSSHSSTTATKDPGQEPFSFQVGLGQVIKGWDESVIDMSLGEVAKIHCSPDYAYGAGGFPAWGE
jgi:hypothetical protein